MTVWVIGGYGNGNVGDDMLAMVSRRAITDFTRQPVMVVAGIYWPGQDAASNRRRTLIKSLKRGDTLCVCGGGLLNDEFGTGYLKYFASIVVAARAKGVRVALVGVGVEHLKSRVGRSLARVIVMLASRISVRDAHSMRNVSRLTRRAAKGVDLGWLAIDRSRQDDNHSYQPVLAVTIAVESSEHASRRIAVLKGAIDRLAADYDLTPLLIPMQTSTEKDLDDVVALQELSSQVERSCMIASPTDFNEVRAMTSGARLMLGYRLHGNMLGAIGGTPVVAISRSPKVVPRQVFGRISSLSKLGMVGSARPRCTSIGRFQAIAS